MSSILIRVRPKAIEVCVGMRNIPESNRQVSAEGV